jgi:hypothetical protein
MVDVEGDHAQIAFLSERYRGLEKKQRVCAAAKGNREARPGSSSMESEWRRSLLDALERVR